MLIVGPSSQLTRLFRDDPSSSPVENEICGTGGGGSGERDCCDVQLAWTCGGAGNEEREKTDVAELGVRISDVAVSWFCCLTSCVRMVGRFVLGVACEGRTGEGERRRDGGGASSRLGTAPLECLPPV